MSDHESDDKIVFGDSPPRVPADPSQLPPFEDEDLTQARPEGPEEFNQTTPDPDEDV